ncbi:MAG: twin-arginine translocase subunit TatC [Candidatus Bathyarchaeia archaeon]
MSDVEQPFWDHLDDLTKRLRRIVLSIAVATIGIASVPADLDRLVRLDLSDYRPMISAVMEAMQNRLLPEGVRLIAFTWLDTFYIYVIVAVVLGTLISLPVIAYEIYRFVDPALFPQERKAIVSFVAAFSVLFSVGAAYAYFILIPTTFRILLRFVYQTRIAPFFSVRDFFNIVAFGLLGSGLFYTFPLLIYILVKIDLVEVQTLRDSRKQIFVGLLIITAILTPDPTPLSMLLMVIPFYLLYELTIQVVSRLKRAEEPADVIERGLRASEELLKGT